MNGSLGLSPDLRRNSQLTPVCRPGLNMPAAWILFNLNEATRAGSRICSPALEAREAGGFSGPWLNQSVSSLLDRISLRMIETEVPP